MGRTTRLGKVVESALHPATRGPDDDRLSHEPAGRGADRQPAAWRRQTHAHRRPRACCAGAVAQTDPPRPRESSSTGTCRRLSCSRHRGTVKDDWRPHRERDGYRPPVSNTRVHWGLALELCGQPPASGSPRAGPWAVASPALISTQAIPLRPMRRHASVRLGPKLLAFAVAAVATALAPRRRSLRTASTGAPRAKERLPSRTSTARAAPTSRRPARPRARSSEPGSTR